MQVSPEETHFLTVGGYSIEKEKVALTLQGRTLTQPSDGWIRILGIPIHTQGGGKTWLDQLTPTWKKLLHLIKRISNKFGGATNDVARTLVQTVLVSKACYGAIHYRLTQVQMSKLKSLYLQALRVITGLRVIIIATVYLHRVVSPHCHCFGRGKKETRVVGVYANMGWLTEVGVWRV